MNRIVVDETLTNQLQNIDSPVELVDSAGRTLGRFVPCSSKTASDSCPYSAAELDAMRTEEGGRPLAEIWRDLGVQ